MDNIRALRAFVEVARAGSFVQAAERLNCSTSTASRLVRELEVQLGQTLLLRTTRSLTLSSFGERKFAECQRIVDAVDSLHHVAEGESRRLQGDLKITATAAYTKQRLIPLLPEFLERHPDLRIHWQLNDERVDLSKQGVDMAIRIANLRDSGMVARRLGKVQIWLVAAPAFLARYGEPQSPQEIATLPCSVCTVPSFRNRWPLDPEVCVDGPVWADCGEVSREAAIAGLGVAYLPDFMVEDAIQRGDLVRLFPRQPSATVELAILYPGRNQITAAASAFGEYLASRLRTDQTAALEDVA